MQLPVVFVATKSKTDSVFSAIFIKLFKKLAAEMIIQLEPDKLFKVWMFNLIKCYTTYQFLKPVFTTPKIFIW